MEIVTDKDRVAVPATPADPKTPPPLKVGDKVRYVPHVCHALHRDADGDYAWVVRKKGQRTHPLQKEVPPDEDFKSADHLHHHLEYIRKLPPDQAEVWKANLIFVLPAKTWPAVVKAVDEKTGLVDLDVTSPAGGVTLHYTVPHAAVKAPHTCHRQES